MPKLNTLMIHCQDLELSQMSDEDVTWFKHFGKFITKMTNTFPMTQDFYS